MSLNINQLSAKQKVQRYTPKAGTVPARLLSVVDLGIQPQPAFKGEAKPPARSVHISFELPNDQFEYQGEMVPARISPKIYKVSNDPKSGLFKFLSSIDPGNKSEGDLAKLINTPCLVTIVHNKVKREDGTEATYANITGVMPSPDGFPVPELHDKPFVFEFDNPDKEVLKLMPAFLRNKLLEAVNINDTIKSLVEEVESERDDGKKDDAPWKAEDKNAVPEQKPSGKRPY